MKLTRRQWLWGLGATALPLKSLLAQQELKGGYRGQLDEYRRMWDQYFHVVNASTNQQLGTPFRLSTAILRFGLQDRFRGRISLRSSDPKAVLPAPYQFGSADDEYESHLFQATLNSEGEHTITVRDEKTGSEFVSNRIVVSAREPKYKLYFGDIHIHSGWSVDGRGSPDYNYVYARDAMNLDFACLTEHDPTEGRWQQIKAKARELYQPGRFATMSAYEWTGHKVNAGHKNVYYRNFEAPVFRSNFLDDPVYKVSAQTWSAFDLWAKLRESGETGKTAKWQSIIPSAAFTVPWNDADPEFQRLVEVYSTWGNSEYADGPRQIRVMGGPRPGHFVQDGLAAGQKLGFVGASDSHSGRPGYAGHGRIYFDSDYSFPDTEVYSGGITGIYAEELTHEAVFDAINSRRCFATTGVRIIVEFRADDHWMGEEFKSNDAPHFSARVVGTAPIESVTLVKNNTDYVVVPGNGPILQFEYDKTEPPKTTDYYYLRVIQADGEMAWSSPVWISKK